MSEDIVAIGDAYSQYVDETYYNNKLGERLDKDFQSYPVKMWLIEIGWVISDPDGFKFL